MNLTLRRLPVVDKALPGELFVDGARFSFTLENAANAIPVGRYPVTLTVSPAVQDGELWSPEATDVLPLIAVPGHSGIRIHSANEYHELQGCVAVGDAPSGAWLGRSRVALRRLLPLIHAALDRHEPIWLTVLEAPKPGTDIKNG